MDLGYSLFSSEASSSRFIADNLKSFIGDTRSHSSRQKQRLHQILD
jgi:hypothetical protein